jgi:hypothetical protein
MKKYQLAFVVAFALSLGLSVLSMIRVAAYTMFLSNAEFSEIFNLTGSFLSLFTLAVVFGVFYFLANKSKINVMKSTILALFLGVFLGSSILYMCYYIYYFFAFGGIHSGYSNFMVLERYLLQIWESFITSAWYLFPALTALLFVELKEKKSNNNLPQENVQVSK